MTAGTLTVTEPPATPVTLLRLELLSAFALRGNGVQLALPAAAERLLAYVALHQRPVSRAEIATTLWPDRDQSRSTGSLRTALWRLRRVSDDVLTVTGTHLMLSDGVTVDARESFAAVQRLRSCSARTLDEGTPLSDWLTMDLLPGWPDEWVEGWRERWRMRRLHVLELLAAWLTTAGRHSEAVDAALAAIQVEPLRESAHRSLIEAHLAAGNRAEAMRAYHRLRRLLDRELGIGPSPDIARMLAAAP